MLMHRLLTICLVAFGIVSTPLTAGAVNSSVYRDGEIEVTITEGPVPAEFRESSGVDGDWFGVSNIITRIRVKIGTSQTIVPLRAFLGMSDPHEVEIKRKGRGRAWTLTISGGDASTSYHAVMEFDGVDVKTVKDFANEADRTHPYATQVFTKPEVLD
jgi:hypothetical protein